MYNRQNIFLIDSFLDLCFYVSLLINSLIYKSKLKSNSFSLYWYNRLPLKFNFYYSEEIFLDAFSHIFVQKTINIFQCLASPVQHDQPEKQNEENKYHLLLHLCYLLRQVKNFREKSKMIKKKKFFCLNICSKHYNYLFSVGCRSHYSLCYLKLLISLKTQVDK